MKQILKTLSSKALITIIIVCIQLVWITLMFTKLNSYIAWNNIIWAIFTIIVFIAVVLSDQNPAYKMSWIILMGINPLFGGILYIFLGNRQSSKKLNKKINRYKENLLNYEYELDSNIKLDKLDERRGIVNYLQNTVNFNIYNNTNSTYFEVGEKMFESMLQDIKKAEKFIFLEYFILTNGKMWERLKQALLERLDKGVSIRLIYDDIGSIDLIDEAELKYISSRGIQVCKFNPIFIFKLPLTVNTRDHRKILVIDGNVGYTGGINIGDEYINENHRLGHWKDTGVRIEGEAVFGLTKIFLQIWTGLMQEKMDLKDYMPTIKKETKGYVLPFADSPADNELVSESVYMDIIWNAKDYVYIYTPYLIIDHEMEVALTNASKRGVDVRIVVPGIPDKKVVYHVTQSSFKILMDAGVKIYKYSRGFIHAKCILSDDDVASVGTVNFDYRSLYLHFENAILFIKTPVIEELKNDMLNTFAISELITHIKVKSNLLTEGYFAILKVLSPLF